MVKEALGPAMKFKLPLRIDFIPLSKSAKKKVKEQNKARELIGEPGIKVTLRSCVECGKYFETVSYRRCDYCRSKED